MRYFNLTPSSPNSIIQNLTILISTFCSLLYKSNPYYISTLCKLHYKLALLTENLKLNSISYLQKIKTNVDHIHKRLQTPIRKLHKLSITKTLNLFSLPMRKSKIKIKKKRCKIHLRSHKIVPLRLICLPLSKAVSPSSALSYSI